MDLKLVCKEILLEAKKKKVKDLETFNKLKLRILKSLDYHKIPKNATIASVASKKDRQIFRKILSMKPVRTISGVAPIALMTDPYPCPHSLKGIGPCTYCPGGPGSVFGNVPQSYTGKEPSTRRSIRNDYDPYLGIFNRLEHYIAMNLVPEKAEVILQGGTFPSMPLIYQEYFVKYLFKAMNDFSSLFYSKKGIDMKKFNNFFELPTDISDEARIERIQKKLLYMKYKDLSNKKELFNVKKILFDDKKSSVININSNNLKYHKKSIKLKKIEKNIPLIKSNKISIKNLLQKVNNLDNPKISLQQMQEDNETAKIRCVGLTIETRSDFGKLVHGNQMLELGCTRIELGIQSIYDKVLKKIHRGNTVKDNIESIRILKDLGFKINMHYMPGLPLTTRKMDRAGLKELFSNPDYMPDMLKVYPCMVMSGTKLYNEWKRGIFKPTTTKEAASLIAEMKRYVPEWCRIMRVQRDIPTNLTSAGVDRTNLRQYVEKIAIEKKIKCRCIRCREAGLNSIKNFKKINSIKLKIFEYNASKGKEFFISAEDTKNDTLFGYCRMRFPSQSLRKEINDNSSLVRELHIYSLAAPIGSKLKESFQHRGLGKMLMKKAEEIALRNGKSKIVVISGIGAREYFKKLGYVREGPYMSKNI